MSAQSDPRYDTQTEGENRIYRLRIVNPWRLTVLNLPDGKIAYNFYIPSDDFTFTNGLVDVVKGMKEIGKESVRKALQAEPYFLGFLEEDQSLMRKLRTQLLKELSSRSAEFT